MAKKLTKLQKSTAIISNSKATKWCYVNTDNEFTFMDETFIIDSELSQYKVKNKAGEVENYTNESYMEQILAVLDNDGNIKFYDQNYDLIENNNIEVKRKIRF